MQTLFRKKAPILSAYRVYGVHQLDALSSRGGYLR